MVIDGRKKYGKMIEPDDPTDTVKTFHIVRDFYIVQDSKKSGEEVLKLMPNIEARLEEFSLKFNVKEEYVLVKLYQSIYTDTEKLRHNEIYIPVSLIAGKVENDIIKLDTRIAGKKKTLKLSYVLSIYKPQESSLEKYKRRYP